MPDAATASALRKVPEVARTMWQFDSVTKAVVGIGQCSPTESTVYDATEENVRDAPHHRDVCGEIAGVIVDAAVTRSRPTCQAGMIEYGRCQG